MTYRGIVSNGVVVLEGEKPLEGTVVEVTTLDQSVAQVGAPASHPAIGLWKDRTDLPDNVIKESKVLRQRLTRRLDE
jgi:hypothetical protein